MQAAGDENRYVRYAAFVGIRELPATVAQDGTRQQLIDLCQTAIPDEYAGGLATSILADLGAQHTVAVIEEFLKRKAHEPWLNYATWHLALEKLKGPGLPRPF
jgi:hypothetical protein